MFLPKQMVLRGSFIPQFQVVSPRLTRVVVKRGLSRHVSCAARINSSLWETLPTTYCRFKNVGVQCKDSSINIQQSTVPGTSGSKLSELAFDKLQLSDEEICEGLKRAFGRFVARGAVVDEEYWTASWLRAESHWESMSYMRHIDSFKRKYAEQEFYSLKRRCAGREGNMLKCLCIVTVKKEDPNVRRTVLNSVVGTLDLSIRQLLHGEKFPGELKRTCSVLASHDASDTHRYAYIANVCVSKFARRQGIASNMLYLATDIAISSGMKQLFVHVNVDNRSAQELYRKVGFEIVEPAPSPLSKDQRFLMCMEL
uniref:N-alpha-acetyltransferase 50 n=1 Tax=Anthurium amnicola TaxID=1678845 RepID=A0A1D1Z8Z4_9ARAE